MADAYNTATTLTSNFKEVYAEALQDFRPEQFVLQKAFRFKPSAKLGNVYHQPILLSREAGFRYAKSGIAPLSGSLVTAIPSQLKDAQLNATQLFGRALIDYEAAARGESSKNAFRNSVGIVIESLYESAQHRHECDLWYGQKPLGIVSSVSGHTVTITDASWAPAVWNSCEGATVSMYYTDLGDKRGTGYVLNTTNGADAAITKVDVINKAITIGSADAAVTGLQAGDYLFWSTQIAEPSTPGTPESSPYNSAMGLDALLDSSASTILNISTDYSRWQPTNIAVNGKLSLQWIQYGVAQAKNKGLDEAVTLYISEPTWATICTEWASLVRFDKDTGTYTLGADALKIRSNGIKVDIMSTPFCKEGTAFMIPTQSFFRIGASELTTEIPGRKGQELFTLVPNSNFYEFQVYQHSALFGFVGKSVKFTGITN